MAVDHSAELVLVHVWEPAAQLYGMPAFPIINADDYLAQAKRDLENAKVDAERVGAKRVSTTVVTEPRSTKSSSYCETIPVMISLSSVPMAAPDSNTL